MTEDIQSLRDDIAYLKALADDGQNSGAVGGWIMIAAGLSFGLASVVQWAALTHVPGVTGLVSNGAWLAALLVFFAVLFTVKRGHSAGANRPTSLAWQGIGWGLFVLFVAIALATWRTQSPTILYFAPSIVLGLYGAAWSTAAALTKKGWLWLTAGGSFLASLISAWLIGDTAEYLFYAAALVLLAAAPGMVFVAADRRIAA
jgi:hypothetical protein